MFATTRAAFRAAAFTTKSLSTRSLSTKAAKEAIPVSKKRNVAVSQAHKRFQHTNRPAVDADTVLILEHLIATSSRMTAELNLILMKLKGRSIDLDTLSAFGASIAVKGKRPERAYDVFYKHYFKVYSAQNPELEPQEVTKIVCDMWGKFSKEEKKNWTLPSE